nr:hypothetical protein [Streptomyces sp. PT12]
MASTPWLTRCPTARATSPPSCSSACTTLTKYPAARAACSRSRSTEAGPKEDVRAVTMPMRREQRVTRARADSLGRNPRRSISRSTRCLTAGLTCGSPLTTRETVFCETPTLLATSAIETRPVTTSSLASTAG